MAKLFKRKEVETTSMDAAENAIANKEVEGLSQRQIVFKRFIHHRAAMVALFSLFFITLVVYTSLDFKLGPWKIHGWWKYKVTDIPELRYKECPGQIIGCPTLKLFPPSLGEHPFGQDDIGRDYLALVTLGFGEIIPQVFFNGEDINGFNLSNGTKGITRLDPIPVGYKDLGTFDFGEKFLLFVLLTIVMIFISLRLRRGRLGRAWLAIREDELAASMMGVPLMRTKLASYAVGAIAGGIGGVAFATHVDGVYAERFNFAISIFLLAMVVMGGMGNVWGVIIGAFLLSWINSTGLPAFGDTFNSKFGTSIDFPSFTFLLFGLVLILMMLFRREGLVPESRLKMVMHEHDEEVEAELEKGAK